MIIYTAIFGRYEELKEPLVVTPGWRYICFTDQPFQSKVWEIHPVANVEDPVKEARRRKILGGVGKTIWVDGSFIVNCDLNEFWEKNFTCPFTVIEHPIRNCVYAEATACIGNKRGNDKDIRGQADKYLREGMPICNGLIQSGILLREECPEVRWFCNLWWEQIKISTRDQIGFAYCEWKLGKWPRIKMDYRASTEFIFKTHFNRRK
jgi:hypothetical protein